MSVLRANIPHLALLCLLAYFVVSQVIKRSCINQDCSATRVTLSNPPVNLFDSNVISQLNDLLRSIESESQTKVVVVSSDVPGFFAAAIDLNILSPTAPPGVNASAILQKYFDNLDRVLKSSKIFIGEVKGRTWGAGDEHLMRMDMRFAGPNAEFGAPEAAVGLIHVGGMQQLVRLIGPGLAMEYMVSAAQVPALEAARTGWVNSVHPTAQALRHHVDRLAARIALFHAEVLQNTKASIAEQAPSPHALQRNHKRFNDLAALPFVAKNVANILSFSNNQSEPWVLNNNDNIVQRLY